MKHFLSATLFCLFVFAGMAQAQTKNDYVEVVYFHGKQRCSTCIALEKFTREVVETDFAEQVRDGSVRFKTVDISTKDGAELAKKYKVSWSSLFVNWWENGKETRNDLTRFGLQNARSKTDEFKKGLKAKINEGLK